MSEPCKVRVNGTGPTLLFSLQHFCFGKPFKVRSCSALEQQSPHCLLKSKKQIYLCQKSKVLRLPVWFDNSLLHLQHLQVPQSIFKMFPKNMCKALTVQTKLLNQNNHKTSVECKESSWYIKHLVNRGHMALFQVRY